jgi:3-phenylpropionate/trans-cinnamate dioxygenase ferredoxin subunit
MQGFEKVAKRAEVSAGSLKLVEAQGEQILLTELGGDVIAFSNICTHDLCDLVGGAVDEDEEIECDCHGSIFNVRTGKVMQPPADIPLPVYSVRIEDGDVLVGPA